MPTSLCSIRRQSPIARLFKPRWSRALASCIWLLVEQFLSTMGSCCLTCFQDGPCFPQANKSNLVAGKAFSLLVPRLETAHDELSHNSMSLPLSLCARL